MIQNTSIQNTVGRGKAGAYSPSLSYMMSAPNLDQYVWLHMHHRVKVDRALHAPIRLWSSFQLGADVERPNYKNDSTVVAELDCLVP